MLKKVQSISVCKGNAGGESVCVVQNDSEGLVDERWAENRG